MNEFEKIKTTLPKIDFKTYNECKDAMLEIINRYCNFLLPDDYREYYSFNILNIEPVESDMLEIVVSCRDGGEYCEETITVPVRYFTDENFLTQAVEEDEARKQAEAQKKLEEHARKLEEQARKLADPEYQEYLRLKQKFS